MPSNININPVKFNHRIIRENKTNRAQPNSNSHTNTHKTSVYGLLPLIGCVISEEEESQSLAGRTMKRASSGRTFPPLLSSSALREPWPKGGEQELDDRVVKWRTNTQYSVF